MTRKLVLSCYTSLDGVIQDPVGMENSGLGNWTGPFSRGPEGDRIMHEELFGSDVVLLGRTTYEGFAAVWPQVEDDTGFAARINSMPKYVASRSLTQAEWNNTTVVADVREAVEELKAEGGGDVLAYGSAGLVHDLLSFGLVDVFHLLVYPTVLGGGTRLFPDGFDSVLKLEGIQELESGIVDLRYALRLD